MFVHFMVNTGSRSEVTKNCGVLLKYTKYRIKKKYLVKNMVGKSSLLLKFNFYHYLKRNPGYSIIEEMFGDCKY